MHASLSSTRIAPKKLNVIAKMVRGKTVTSALVALAHTHKKAARIVEGLLKSALANATFNDKQREDDLRIKTIVVNQGSSYRRGVPMARGRVRPMRKFLSHLEIVLGLKDEENVGTPKSQMSQKMERNASQRQGKTVKDGGSPRTTQKKKKSRSSSDSSDSSHSSSSTK